MLGNVRRNLEHHEPNRPTLEKLIGNALAQGIITRPVEVESLFAESALGLVG